jgi:hypothetical protein
VDSILLSSLVSIPRRSSKTWIERSLVWCLLFLDSIPLISVVAMASGSKECESRAPFLLVLRVQTLVCLYLIDCNISSVLAVTTAPLRTREMS